MTEGVKACHADEAIAIVSNLQKVELSEKKHSVKLGSLTAITGMVTETLLMSPISTNRQTH